MKCETTALGASAADGRFRIFKEGAIRTDYGLSIMTPSAGAALIKRFEARGNDMPIDLRHGMLAENPTLSQSEAYGWIPCPGGLEYVKGDGLYARGVQWDPQVRAGLQTKPPRWKYFSPTYDVDPKSRIILDLTNVALTNLPATHGLNRLAAERGKRMDLAKCGMVLAMLMQKADAGDQEAASMRDMLIAALGDQVEAALAAAQGGGEVEAESEDITAGMSDSEKNAYEALSDNMKAALVAGIKAQKAEAAPEEVATEAKPEDDKTVAASITAEQLLLISKGEMVDTMAPRQKIVAELVGKGLVKRGGETEKMLLSASLPESEFTKFVAARRVASATIPGKAPVSPAPATKSKASISAEARAAAHDLAKKVPGGDVNKILAKMGAQ